MTTAVLACIAIGAVTVAATLTLGHRPSAPSRTNPPAIATEDYGKRLIAQTPELLGPDVADAAMRYTTSRLSCGSCHLGTGTEPGSLTLLLTSRHYPRFSGRVGAQTDIEDRVNECMQRSMNGKPLPANSPEMIAMAAYLRALGARNAATAPSLVEPKDPPAFKIPGRAADPNAGQQVFTDRCAPCHGADGLGLLAAADRIHGYVFPPLWGPDSFNDGAGMHRVLTSAAFIKARMPLGKPDLTNDQSFDVAAYLNAQPRPHMPNLERDYPDRTTKPIDNPYGPYADPFPQSQHQFGPFAPIQAFYQKAKS